MGRHSSSALVWGTLAILALAVAGCSPSIGVTSTVTVTPTSTLTPTPAPTCASVLPGAGALNLGGSFVYPFTSPPGTVGNTPTTIISGTGLFTVHKVSACTPHTTPAAVIAFYNSQLPALPHGWIGSPTFPFDGGLMQGCSAPCFFDPKGGPLYYLVFDQLTAHGNVVSYRLRWAVFPDTEFPNCGPNFTSGPPAVQLVYFVPGFAPAIPVPPVSSVTQSASSGGQKLIEVCSPGNAVSVNAFMTKELPATGWAKVGASGWCTSACWVNKGVVIMWGSITDQTDWFISWHT